MSEQYDVIVNPRACGVTNYTGITTISSYRRTVVVHTWLMRIILWYAVWEKQLVNNSRIYAYGLKRDNFITRWMIKKYREHVVDNVYINDNLPTKFISYIPYVGNRVIVSSVDATPPRDSTFILYEGRKNDDIFCTFEYIPETYGFYGEYLKFNMEEFKRITATYNLYYYLRFGCDVSYSVGNRDVFNHFIQH